MIDTFSKEDFESYLSDSHSPFDYIGLVDGEHTYQLPLDNQVSITIRSSVKSNGLSADVGKDSIRCWLVNGDKPLGSKISKWTTRQSGWQDRMYSNIKQLVLWRALAGDCKKCGRPKGIFKAQTETNKGRPFAKCREHNGFVWLDEPIKKSDIYFSEESNGSVISKTAISKSIPPEIRGGPRDIVRHSNDDGTGKITSQTHDRSFDLQEMPNKTPKNQQKQAIEAGKKNDIYFSKESHKESNDTNTTANREQVAHSDRESRKDNGSSLPQDGLRDNGEGNISQDNISTKTCRNLQELPKSPNQQQKQAIEAPIDANLRVLASPGSGKTFIIEYRYKFLADNSINPDNIVVCTFGKQAATDMGQRIKATCSEANLEQICTINALCYRLLAKWYPNSRWYKWSGPKDWQIKKTLEDIIGPIWQESEKPSAQEVYNYINTSKYLSLTTDDSYLWFVDTLGQERGAWLYEIRSKFDAWLNRNKFLTFADQLFLVEQQLKNDSDFRQKIQERFSHIIVDEGQDTNFQAMRILITISLEPGQNTVYESEMIE